MDTKPLESFAKAARRELIVAVEARVSTVLDTGSVARSERSQTVRLLESVIADHGREHVIDRVAYTWFNRLIALRFMDARGYTDAGIVSPASGQAHGQPEILADAKRGDVNTDVVTNASAHEAIVGLLDGTRRSTDAEGEAYALLLTEYCRHWHKSLPFMFEAEGAYTELLVPSGLLADGALLSRAREVLTEDVCDDVEVIGWLYQFYISERKDEVFAGFKKNKKAGADEIPAATQLFTPHWIVKYLLENSLGRLWMLNRPSSRLVKQMDYYIAPIDEATDFLKVSGPEELTVIDPACGSGHMLTYAFDLLYAIYEEEGYAPSDIPGLILTHNLYGTEIDPRAGALAAFALTMKARAKDRRFFTRSNSLVEPSSSLVESGRNPQICVIEPILFAPDELDVLVTRSGDRDAEVAFWNQFREADTLGSLIQSDVKATAEAAVVLEELKDQEGTLYYDMLARAGKAVAQAEVLSREYSVVTANPPYMIAKNMNATLAEWVKKYYPTGGGDLYGAFIERCVSLSATRAFLAMIAMQSWMFIPSFEVLRRRIASELTIVTLSQFGANAFDTISGEIVSTAAFVLRNGNRKAGEAGSFLRLVEGKSESAKSVALLAAAKEPACPWLYRVSQSEFGRIPGMPIAYWIGPNGLRNFQSKLLGDVAAVRTGMTTSDNARFLRSWSEVSLGRTNFNSSSAQDGSDSGRTWFPYNKGGGFRRWYGFADSVINWYGDGAEIKGSLDANGKRRASVRAEEFYFKPAISYSAVSGTSFSARLSESGFLFDSGGSSVFAEDPCDLQLLTGILCSKIPTFFLQAFNETINFQPGDVARIPVPQLSSEISDQIGSSVAEAVQLSAADWNRYETSWGFHRSPLVPPRGFAETALASHFAQCISTMDDATQRMRVIEELVNSLLIHAYRLEDYLDPAVPESEITLLGNPAYRFGKGKTNNELELLQTYALAADLVSYAVGCMFGRYSLDEPGLMLADQGATLKDYLAKVVASTGTVSDTFTPDADNVIPFVDDGWFEDDVVERFRQFLKIAFGAEHFEANLRFVEESLGVKTLRDHFITKSGRSKFYDDHVKRYKKRPIYWMFSSPKGSFNALIYLHRYTPSTVSTVLNEYLREYENKLQKAFEHAETAAAGGTSVKDQKEADRLRKVLAELRDYEHDVLYPLATQQVEIDLDDGVKVNYPRFYPAVKKIVGLEASDG
ncbi:BREX-1 system adenine-specific DNA-methyltransferase PglX [Rhodococcus erythropolis]|uniref:BREX-1 system adenine-specific DNA-methyltransferase PglX n=1 Tax=Rhodococcus erythropolis TaxID=1833 RepID=UPI0022B3A2EE|nr:BREX-1 system adenine-specific DNA-methyltransferase PglX [Rhodococcus erythropolis]MCZ4566981.1 BREX-1 system adenine-specific DNA-methyltransferase PglX [Rhodococcus erythropolis]